jgi:hypothetical protein
MKIQPKYCLFIVSLVIAASAFAQYRGGENADQFVYGRRSRTFAKKGDIHLRWYPFGLINTADMNVTFGAEYVYADKKSISFDAGYIFASIYGNSNGDLMPATGWLTRLNHRWYLSDARDPLFLEAEAALKAARYKSGDQWVGRGVVDGVPAYEQLMEVTSRKEVFMAAAKFGQHVSFAPGGRLGFEWAAGLGVRYRHYYPDLPDDAQVITFGGWGFNPWNYGEDWLPDFQLTFRLTWKLK